MLFPGTPGIGIYILPGIVISGNLRIPSRSAKPFLAASWRINPPGEWKTLLIF